MASSILLESRPYRPFKSSEEYLEAMREDLAEWLNTMYPEVMINSDNFMDCLDTGVVLCKHANNVRQAAEDYLVRRQTRNKSMLRSMTSGLAGPILAMGNVYYLPTAKSGTFFARDNVSNFITWCRKALKIFECLLFETDDLIMRKNEKHVILCLLEVARLGVKFGMLAPMLIQMERQIDREIAADNKANGTDCDIGNVNNVFTSYELDTDSENEDDENPMLVYGPQPQIITNDLKSLDEMVRDLLEKCTCPSQFPMIRVSEGKYRIGDTKILIFVRILRSHVMVRVGGGWDTLSHYLDKHDPCRCKSQHRSSVAAKLIPRANNQTNGIELHHAQVIFERSSPMTTNVISNSSEDTGNNQNSISSLASFATKGRNCSPVPSRKDNFLSSPYKKLADNSNSASPRGRHKNITISTKQLSNTVQKQLSSELDAELPVHFVNLNLNRQSDNNQDTIDQDTTISTNLTTDNKFENISDNSSEISDEGYRSLGIANFTNFQQQRHGTVYNQALSIDDPEGENTYLSRDLLCQELQSKTQNQLDDFISKVAVGDNKIKVDIAASTGLRKTNFSDKIYGLTKNGENIKIQPEKSIKKKTSKIPQSPVIVRKHGNANCKNDLKVQSNVTVNSCQQHENKIYFKENQGKSAIANNSGIYHRSVSNFETVPFRKNANTWSGGRSKTTKKRSAITEESFVPPTTENSSRGRSLVVLYDSSNRRIRCGSSSLTTSPVKNMSSPLKQQLLRTAERAKSDVQILEKMKGLLNEYSDFLDNAEKTKSNEKCDLTTAWVHNNGTFNRSDTCLGRFKNSSASSSMENTFIKNNSTSDIANARKDRGLSKIPTRIRNHTQLY